MRRAAKANAGFSLVEILISILALALISGFILELFIISARVNAQVGDRDNADTQIITILETFKTQKDPDKLIDDELFAQADLSESGSIKQYYDKNWDVVDAETASAGNDYFMIEVVVGVLSGSELVTVPGFTENGEDYGDETVSAFYEITATAYPFSGGLAGKKITAQTTGMYFQNIGAVPVW